MVEPLHILLVDDDKIFCEYFQNLTKPFSIILDVVHTFNEGKQFIESGKAGAYILDANLPDGSGFDLAALVREKHGEAVPIVVISGVFRDSAHFSQLKEHLHVNYVLDKPINAEDAQRLLGELCPNIHKSEKSVDPMQRLKDKYKQMIPGIVKDLEALVQTVKSQKNFESITALKQSVHKIAGSAGSVGFPAVSDLCKQWERGLIKQLETLDKVPLDPSFFETQDDFLSQIKFEYQVSTRAELESVSSEGREEEGGRRIPLYVVDSDRELLAALEKEHPEFDLHVTTEWDPSKAMKFLEEKDFNPRILIVGESFKGSTITGKDLIEAARHKSGALHTTYGIILDHEDLKKRADAIQEGITYVLEKPISGILFLNSIKGVLHYEEHPDFKVLIVDDDEFICDFISMALNEVGVMTKSLTDGSKLYEAIHDFRPDLLLLDIYLPGYNGVELLKTLRSDVRFSKLMIVIVTASKDNELLSDAYTSNVDDILHKPLDKKIVQTRILSLARKHAELHQFERRDSVTGLPNETAFHVYVHEKLLNAEYARVGVFVALIEIDQFVTYMNRSEGKDILRRFSNLMIGRDMQLGYESYLGGGKFAVVSDMTDLHSFKLVVESFLERARQEILIPDSLDKKFTFSCGIISLPLHYTSMKEVLKVAESALNEAKQLGVDRPIKVVTHLSELQPEAQKRKVILIDPDEDLMQIIRTSLEAKGLDVACYNLGETFLEELLIKDNPLPPLIILERRLPDMDGIDLMRRLHKRYPMQLPVIFLSTLSSDKDVMDGLKAGALDYITKPFNLHQLIQKSITALTR